MKVGEVQDQEGPRPQGGADLSSTRHPAVDPSDGNYSDQVRPLIFVNRVRSSSSTKADDEWLGSVLWLTLVGEMRLHRGTVDRFGFGVR